MQLDFPIVFCIVLINAPFWLQMFGDIRKFVETTTSLFQIPRVSMLASITGQPSEDVGHLTAGLNYVDANITGKAYQKDASPFLFA
jgi:hypothetical protein